jgi:hypothetical protein
MTARPPTTTLFDAVLSGSFTSEGVAAASPFAARDEGTVVGDSGCLRPVLLDQAVVDSILELRAELSAAGLDAGPQRSLVEAAGEVMEGGRIVQRDFGGEVLCSNLRLPFRTTLAGPISRAQRTTPKQRQRTSRARSWPPARQVASVMTHPSRQGGCVRVPAKRIDGESGHDLVGYFASLLDQVVCQARPPRTAPRTRSPRHPGVD